MASLSTEQVQARHWQQKVLLCLGLMKGLHPGQEKMSLGLRRRAFPWSIQSLTVLVRWTSYSSCMQMDVFLLGMDLGCQDELFFSLLKLKMRKIYEAPRCIFLLT